MDLPGPGLDRRRFVELFAGLGVAGTALTELLWAQAADGAPITRETLAAAETLAGLQFTDEERNLALTGIEELRQDYLRLREVALDNSVAPALRFDPEVRGAATRVEAPSRRLSTDGPTPLPDDEDAIAFLPAVQLGRHVRDRQISSLELTTLYLERLERYDPLLQCVVTLTDERALGPGARAPTPSSTRGVWRGPLHGIPWGAKDLLAVRGYPTTWGATPYRDQVIDEDATVVRRLDEAGAVLVAKLTLGALAWGDVWFGGTTRNPWNPEQGSSGSSAGPAAATAAGLVGFAIGTETWGSIVSPCTRCGVTGLRPTFGRVSRHGAMALSWSMDKIGPIVPQRSRTARWSSTPSTAPTGSTRPPSTARSAGIADARRRRSCGSATSPRCSRRSPRVRTRPSAGAPSRWRALDLEVLEVLRSIGIDPAPIELPDLPVGALSFILSAEAAAAFDELTRSGRDDQLVRQEARGLAQRLPPGAPHPGGGVHPGQPRAHPGDARDGASCSRGVDVYVCPSFGGDNLLLTNLTGHPAVVVPNGFTSDGTPTSITFSGRLYGEAEILAVARAYQEATGFHLRHPTLHVEG